MLNLVEPVASPRLGPEKLVRSSMTKFAVLAALLALSACATTSPEAKVRARLMEAGLSQTMAGCMAERLVDRLSMQELRRLGSLAKLGNRDLGSMTIDEFLHRIRALDDPHILTVVTRAGIGCAIAG
jgi:hypothetical protein